MRDSAPAFARNEARVIVADRDAHGARPLDGGPTARSLKRHRLLVLSALTLGAFALRVFVLCQSGRLGADEAVSGLMARHILSGELPVFYWGQSYLGAAEAYLVAGLFAAFGSNPWLLYVPALCASTTLVPLTWALAEQVGPPPAGFLAALPMAIPTPMFSRLLSNAGGGFALGFALQLAAVLCALVVLERPRHTRHWVILFALLTGFAAWIWQPALVALTPVGLVLLIRLGGRHVAYMALALIGLAPALAFNVANGFPTLASVGLRLSAQPPLELDVLSIALGGGEETLGGANPLQTGLLATALLIQPLAVLWLTMRSKRCTTWRSRALATGVVLLVAVLNMLAAHSAARYLVPLVVTATALTGALLATLGQIFPRGLAIAVPLPLLVVAIVNARDYIDVPRVLAAETLSRVDATQAAVVALDDRALRTGYADYWSAYPITYLSGERIVVAPLTGVDRYPAYTRHVNAVAQPADLFVLVDRECRVDDYLTSLDAEGATYQVEEVGRWWLIWHVATRPGADASIVRKVDAQATC